MRIFKTSGFQQWARKEGLADDALRQAITEMENGLVEANLGGSVYRNAWPYQGVVSAVAPGQSLHLDVMIKPSSFMALPRTGRPI